MKIQIDTKAKTVSVEGPVNIAEFINEIKTMLPDWETYSLETNVVINNWSAPVVTNSISPQNPNPYEIKSGDSEHLFNIVLN